MTERSFDEMIAYFNRRVADMYISQDFKIELLGMVAALGYKHEQTARRWIPCSERLPEKYQKVLTTAKGDRVRENFLIDANSNEWSFDSYSVIAWMPLPEPWKEEKENLMSRPTERQMEYAEYLAKRMCVELPKEYTKQAYSDFISKWRPIVKHEDDSMNEPNGWQMQYM